MNPEKQKNNQDTDLGFILEQSTGVPSNKKKLDKKVIIIITLIFLCLLIMVLSTVFSAKKNVKSNQSSVPINTLSKEETVTKFVEYSTAGNKDEAYKLLSNRSEKNKQQLGFDVDDFWQNINKDSCSFGAPVSDSELVYNCLTKENKPFNLNITVSDDTDGYRIGKYLFITQVSEGS